MTHVQIDKELNLVLNINDTEIVLKSNQVVGVIICLIPALKYLSEQGIIIRNENDIEFINWQNDIKKVL